MSGINYQTNFHIGQSVKIISGLYKGQEGTVKDYTCSRCVGLETDNINRGHDYTKGQYTIKLGFMSEVIVMEYQIVTL